jgi:hypothetical protein
MRSRSYALALAAIGAGGIALIVAYGMTWTVTEVALLPGDDTAVRAQESTGASLYPGAAAAGWVALAAVAGIIATRRTGRVVVAVIGALAGVAGAVPALLSALDPDHTGTGWLLALVGGVAVTVACVATVVRGRTWPTMGRRYERGSRPGRELSDWETQDLGRDPTDDLVE